MRLLSFALVCLILNGVFILRATAQVPIGEIIGDPPSIQIPPDFDPVIPPQGPPYLPHIDLGDCGFGGMFVQPDSLKLKDHDWIYYPAFQPHPAIPDQSSMVLTDRDSLVISVPIFGHGGMLGGFETTYSIEGNQIYLDGYSLYSGVVTETIYGPMDYLEHIDPLAPGEYTIHLRYFQAMDSELHDFDAFKADPEQYAKYLSERDSTSASLSISQGTLTFSVVPEPSAALLIAMAAGTLSLASFVKRRRSR